MPLGAAVDKPRHNEQLQIWLPPISSHSREFVSEREFLRATEPGQKSLRSFSPTSTRAAATTNFERLDPRRQQPPGARENEFSLTLSA